MEGRGRDTEVIRAGWFSARIGGWGRGAFGLGGQFRRQAGGRGRGGGGVRA